MCRRLKAAEPNPEIVPLPEELADVPSDVVTGPKVDFLTIAVLYQLT